jgi:hypothetical protein
MSRGPGVIIVLLLCLVIPTAFVILWVGGAAARLEQSHVAGADEEEIAVAAASDAGYCSLSLKKILRRVLQSCGLLGKGGSRGCQPLKAKTLATVSGSDFNALFEPMKDRGGIVQFEAEQATLDAEDRALIDRVFTNQRGASYFFIVARSSADGPVEYNRDLSKRRAEAVLGHLTDAFDDPDLDREVGLLWLGEEFAQLDDGFCSWSRSGDALSCSQRDVNRGAFMAWIDCRL